MENNNERSPVEKKKRKIPKYTLDQLLTQCDCEFNGPMQRYP